jgi:ELWxxDGT repeat protein
MKKYYNTLGFLILMVLGCVGQVQISDVQKIVQTDQSAKKFIVENQNLYLVEADKSKTIVSLVNENGLEPQQEWTHQPLDENRVFTNSIFFSELNLLIEGDTLFEVFTQTVNATSVSNGVLMESHHPVGEQAKILNVEKSPNEGEWLIEYTKNGSNSYGIYNYKSRQFIERSLDSGTRIGDKVYKLTPEGFVSEDLITGERKTEVALSQDSFVIKYNWDTSDNYVWIQDGKGKQFYIDAKYGLRELPCLLPAECIGVYWTDTLIFYHLKKGTFYENNVLSTNGCNLLSQSWMTSSANYFSLHVKEDLRVCYTIFGSTFSTGQNAVYNPTSKEWVVMNFYSDVNYARSQRRIDDRIYIGGQNDIELYGYVATLHEIDLENYSVQYKKFYDQNDDPTQLIFEKHPITGYTYVYTRSLEGQSDLWVIKSKGGNPQKIKSFVKSKNLGIQYISHELLVGDKLFYSYDGAIYVTYLDQTIKIAPAIQSSPFLLYNGFIYALIQKENQIIYYLRIDPVTFETKSKLVGTGIYIDNYLKVLGNGIVGTSYEKDYYFDASSVQLRVITYNGFKLHIENECVSQKNMLFYGYQSAKAELYLWNVEEDKIQLIEGFANSFHNILSDYEGGFYLIPTSSGSNKKILKMNASGVISELASVGVSPGYYYNEEIGLAGTVHTFPYPGVNEIMFFSEKEGKINVNTIPFENTLYYRSFYWTEVDETVVVETQIGGKNHTWIWKFDESPVDVTPAGRSENLLKALIKGDTVVLQYHDMTKAEIHLVLYDLRTKNLELKKSIVSSQFYLNGSTHEWVDNHTCVLSLFTPETGNELWKYDVTSNELILVKDFVEGRIGSDPDNFIRTEHNLYFLSVAPDASRQWFAINGSSASSDLHTGYDKACIYPNPAINEVRTKQNCNQVEIYDLNGRIRYSARHLQTGDRIDLSGIEPGLYMVTMIAEQGEKRISKLVIGSHP